MSSQESLQEELDSIRQAIKGLLGVLDAQLIGQPQTTRQILECLIAGGHALIEGAPGLGKTTLVRTLASCLDLDFQRIQFTPDLMPADIIGARILNFDERGAQGLTFEPGPIHTQVLLADEINRATPRTQSALLEAMEEHQVTVFGETRKLDTPFMVVATQNPIEMEGTFPLPEAQLDRFMVKLLIDMPKASDLAKLFGMDPTTRTEGGGFRIERSTVLRMQELAAQVPVGEDVARRLARIIHATHPSSPLAGEKTRALVRHGSSPRGGLAMLAMARARTLMAGGLHVKMDELDAVAVPCLRHRLLLNYEGMAGDVPITDLIEEAIQQADN
ncbi:MAG: AAA family ATPase, partial [Planctomycetes bacterium]|nr:AAA family ATPase [Planctomycetota bacterium]